MEYPDYKYKPRKKVKKNQVNGTNTTCGTNGVAATSVLGHEPESNIGAKIGVMTQGTRIKAQKRYEISLQAIYILELRKNSIG